MTNLVQRRPTDLTTIAVIEDRFDVLPPAHDSRINISEQQSFTPAQFNTLQNPVTRDLTITGVSLHWDGTERVLPALELLRDVARIVVIADEVRIERPLIWRGTTVEINARKLVFREEGRIETTPEEYTTVALTEEEKRDEDKRPVDSNGNVKAKDGRDGEPGGAIFLNVGEIVGANDSTLRLVTHGGRGEMGETGGLRKFEGRVGGPPTKDVDSIAKDKIEAVFKDANHSTKLLSKIDHWKTFGGIGTKGFDALWTRFTGDMMVKGEFIELHDHEVTDVRIGLGFMKGLDTIYHEIQLPLRGSEELRHITNSNKMAALWESTAALKDPWIPSRGENAFPSGYTGRGGAGGKIFASTPNSISAKAISNRGGDSELSPFIAGGAPGKPTKFIYGAFAAMQAEFAFNPSLGENKDVQRTLEVPEFTRKFGTTTAGDDAEGRSKGAGPNGGEITPVGARDWLEPRLLRIMADYARELYGAGHRERAWEVLAPYWHATRNRDMTNASSEARSSLRTIENLVQNYQQNLDVYGNPPGWVPRFSASNYLQTYLGDRKFSYRFVGTMNKAIQLMNSLEHANAMLQNLSARTEDVIEQIRGELFQAYGRYEKARDILDKVEGNLKDAQQKLDALKAKAAQIAEQWAQEKAIITAVFDVSAAVLAAIPVYQPALSGIGTIVKGIGGVVTESIYSEKKPNGWDALATISGSVGTMLAENADSFKEQFDTQQQEKYKDTLDPSSKDLKTQVAQIRTAIERAQDIHDGAIITAYDAIKRDEALSKLLSTDPEITARLAQNAKNHEQLERELNDHNRMLDDLGNPSNDGTLKSELAQKRRQRLLIARAKLYTLMANAQNETRDLGTVAAHRAEFEENNAQLEKLLPDFEKLEADDKMKDANKTFGKVLGGAERLANGAAAIGTAISSAIQPPDPESEEVLAFKARILESEYGEEYARLQAVVNSATAQMSAALLDLASCNQNVLTLSADFVTALQSSIDIGRNRQAFALSLDAQLKASLGAMQRQARQRMDYFLYLFRKAYMYEFCASPGSAVANLNTFIKQIDNWLANTRAALNPPQASSSTASDLSSIVQLSNMDMGEIGNMGNDALQNTLSALAAKLLERRRSQGVPVGNTFRLDVDESQRLALSSQKRVDLGVMLDLLVNPEEREQFLLANPILKFTSISIERGDFVLRQDRKPEPPIRIVITVGREFVLYDGARYVLFRIGKSEQPLEFGFVANTFDKGEDAGLWVGNFVADSRLKVDDVFTTVMAEGIGQSISYTEINPSFLSTVSVAVPLGRNEIENIDCFKLTVGWQANG